ncbi:hypothetical protein [Terrabacter sp. C0L_2]|uniref:hypothetical protein n=1 Tax=Terrabacter sp. C0L_2 TaxID=3108389 RepID=UPI002ED61F41|nr:hypothetical protein U5C87_17760 [Terrabacter sp. C0L_2]
MSDTTTPATPAAPVAEQPKPAAPAAPETPVQRDAADEPLGQPGLKALQAERDRVTALENELKGFKPLKEQMDALRGIFGDKAADPGKDIVTTLQDQVAEMRHDTLVERVARSHGISDDKDVAVLRAIKDESLMQQLAERLKASNNTPPTPAHDPSQGSAPISEAAAADAAYQAFFPSSSK